jgi:phage baseplate assembly protein W
MARYLDFFTSFMPHPDTGQLLFKTDERVINQSIRNLLLTNRGERPFENSIGGSLRTLLFDLFDDHTEDLARDYVLETLKLEPRARINNVSIKSNENAGALFILIEYVHSGSSDPVSLTVTLSRVR